MLIEWTKQHNLKEVLKASDTCYPYPSCENRDVWDNINAGRRAQAVQCAEKWLGQEWAPLPATFFMDFVRNGDRLRYQKPHYERRYALGDLVIGECLENKGRFLDDIINLIWCICEESFWGVPAHNWSPGYHGEVLPNVENPYVDLFAAETAGLLAWTRYLLGSRLDEVTHLIVRRIDIELQRRIIKPFLEHEDFFWMGFDERDTVNNWNAWIISNLTGVFLMTDYDSHERIRGLKKLMLCLDRFINIYPDDGGCDEGTSYWLSAGGALFDTLDQLQKATGGAMDFSHDKKLGEIAKFIYRSHISGRYFINFADGSAQVNIPRDMVYRFGKYINDKKMMGLAVGIESIVEEVDIPQPLRREIPAIFNTDEFLNDKGQPPYERDVWMKNLQVMAAREQGESDRGLYLAVKGGHNGECHNHNDVGSCIVFLDGCPLLIDVGVGTYTRQTFSDDRYDIWTMQSRYHNLPDINGCMQQPGKEFGAEDVSYVTDEGRVMIEMNIAGAYPEQADILQYVRRYTLVRDADPYVHITDKYEFNKESNHLALNFMCWKKPEILQPGRLLIPLQNGIVAELEYPRECTVEVEHKDTPDDKLYHVWGDSGISRIILTPNKTGCKGSLEVVIRRQNQ